MNFYKTAFVFLGVITVLILNGIIWLGTAHESLDEISPLFNTLIGVMDFCLVLSSAFFIKQSYTDKQYVFTALFVSILTVFLVAFIIRLTDVMGINVIYLFAFDIVVVNIYLVYLTRNWNRLLSDD